MIFHRLGVLGALSDDPARRHDHRDPHSQRLAEALAEGFQACRGVGLGEVADPSLGGPCAGFELGGLLVQVELVQLIRSVEPQHADQNDRNPQIRGEDLPKESLTVHPRVLERNCGLPTPPQQPLA